MADKTIPLLEPGMLKGFRSAQDPSSLDEAHAALITNGRLGTSIVQSRNPDALVVALPANGTVVGTFECYQDGTLAWFVAISDGTRATVYKSTDQATWTNITPSSGPYGDTRLAMSGATAVWFSVFKDKSFGILPEYDCVCIQNGVVAPRIYAKAISWSTAFSAAAYGTSIVTQPDAMVDGARTFAMATFSKALSLNNTAAPPLVITNSAPGVLTFAAGVPGAIGFTILATVAAGDNSIVQWPSGIDCSGSKQFVVEAIETNTQPSFLINCKIQISSDGITYTTLFDASEGLGNAVICPPVAINTAYNQNMVAYAIPSTTNDLSSIKYVKMFWTGPVPATLNAIGFLRMFAASGTILGNAEFGVALASSDSRAIGPGLILSAIVADTDGAISNSTSRNNIPINASIYYDYKVYFTNPSTTMRDAGIDQILVFRRDAGEFDDYYVQHFSYATWGGASWAYASGSSGTSVLVSGSVAGVQDFSRPIPDAFVACTPVGTCMAAANGRFFVGQTSKIWYSAYLRPSEFREVIEFLDAVTPAGDSAGSLDLDGEQIQQISTHGLVAVGQESVGSTPNTAALLHFWTNVGFYQISGYDAISLNKRVKISPNGTFSPFSVAKNKNRIYWLDNELQVRVYDGVQMRSLSMYKVDNYTRAVTSPFAVSGACQRDRYYCQLTTTSALVWMEGTNEWESLDSFTATTSIMTTFYSSLPRIIMFRSGSPGSVYEYDKQGASGTVAFGIQFRDIGLGFMQGIVAAKLGVHCDGYTGGTIATSKEVPGKSDGTTTTGSIAMGTTGTRLWAYDTVATGSSGYLVRPSFTTTVPGAWNLWQTSLQIRPVGSVPARP